MNVGQIGVGTTVVTIVNANPSRYALLLYNVGSAAVYIAGTSSVTVTTGFPIFAGNAITINYTGAVYAIASPPTNVAYIEITS